MNPRLLRPFASKYRPWDVLLSNTAIPENAGVGYVVGTLTADPPHPGYTFQVLEGPFAVVGNQLVATQSFDHEAGLDPYSVWVRAFRWPGLYLDKEFGITVSDVNEAPSSGGGFGIPGGAIGGGGGGSGITLSANTILHGNAVGAVIGAISATDPDEGDVLTYSLSGANPADEAAFTVVGNELRAAVSFDYDTQSSYLIGLRATDSGGLFVQSTFSISVSGTAPAVVSNPAGGTVNEGGTFTVSALTEGGPMPTIQWQLSRNSGFSWENIPMATNTTYTTPVLQYSDDAIQYRAVFTNAFGVANTTAAVIQVNDAPAVTLNPTSVTKMTGTTATFTAAASGDPVPTIQWQVSTNGGSTFTNISGATSLSYTTPAVATSDDGKQYRAVFTNAAGTVNSSAAALTVGEAPVVTQSPSNATISEGNTVTLTASATGYPAPVATWEQSTDGGVTWDPAAS